MSQSTVPEPQKPGFEELIPKEPGTLAPMKPKTNPLAVASLVLALLPLVFNCIALLSWSKLIILGVLSGISYIAAIILGSIAKKQIKASNGEQGGKALANWGIGIAVLAIILFVVGIVLIIALGFEAIRAIVPWISSLGQ